jgi:hypothetical protein
MPRCLSGVLFFCWRDGFDVVCAMFCVAGVLIHREGVTSGSSGSWKLVNYLIIRYITKIVGSKCNNEYVRIIKYEYCILC